MSVLLVLDFASTTAVNTADARLFASKGADRLDRRLPRRKIHREEGRDHGHYERDAENECDIGGSEVQQADFERFRNRSIQEETELVQLLVFLK